MTTVMIFGTFDGIHEGHEFLFKKAKEHGDTLVAIVGRDETVLKVKGKYPARDEDMRLQELAKHPLIDLALLGRTGDKYAIIQELQPDVICLGYDQDSFTEGLPGMLAGVDFACEIVRVKAHRPELFKSSLING